MANGNGTQYLPTAGEGKVPQWFGMYDAYISVNADPTDTGRVKLRIPQVLGNTSSGWASPLVGQPYIPAVGTQVVAMFIGGDPTRPVWTSNKTVAGPAPVTIGSGPPSDTGSYQVGEIYYDKSDGMLTYEWNGVAWVPYQIGTAAIATGVGLTEPAITGGTITGAQFIADGTSGEFLGYTGSPALGNMLISISPVDSTDSENNAYSAGIYLYGTDKSSVGLLNTGTSAAVQLQPPSVTQLSAIPQVFAFANTPGTSTETQYLAMTSGATDNQDAASILINGEAGDGSTAAVIQFAFGLSGSDPTPVVTVNPTGIWTSQSLYLQGNTTTPTPVTATPILYATTAGTLQVVDGVDGQAYGTQRLSHVTNADQTFTSSTFTTVFTTVNLGEREYRVHGQLFIDPTVTGEMAFQWYASNGATGLVSFTVVEGTSTWSTGGQANGASANPSITTSPNANYTLTFDGAFSSSGSGTFQLQAAVPNGTGSYIIKEYSFIDIMPV